MTFYDAIVVGASFAGIASAQEMAKRGLRVAVLERKKDVEKGIRTTGIVVDEAKDLLSMPESLYKKISQVRIYSPALSYIEIVSDKYLFLATDTPKVMRHLMETAEKSGVTFFLDTLFTHAAIEDNKVIVNHGAYTCRFLIGADGAKSKVAHCFNLGTNKKFLVGAELEYQGIELDNPNAFYCFLHHQFAPGYIGWAIPGPKVMQIGIAGSQGHKPNVSGFLQHITSALNIKSPEIVERRGGLIPVGGLVEPFYNSHVILVGDSAGIVSPLTAGGIHTALFYGKRLGELLHFHLQQGGVHPGTVLQKEYPRFLLKHIYRFIFEYTPDWVFNMMIGFPGFKQVANAMFFLKKRLPKRRRG